MAGSGVLAYASPRSAFNSAVTVEASRIELPQADLGDLFLAATASVFDLILVTADSQLLECAWLKTLSAG